MTGSEIPLYMSIVETLHEQIEDGTLSTGDRLESERTLADRFGVNRRTIRQSLDVLDRRGSIERRRGAGTFVAPPRIERGAAEFFHFTERARQRGLAPGARILHLDRITPTTRIASELELSPAAEVYRCHRLRTLNDDPILIETFSVPADLFPGFDRFDIGSRSVYEIMREEYDIDVQLARQSLEAVALSEIEAQWLGAAAGSPAMLERRLAFDHRGRPVDFGTDLYRGDRVRFVTDNATVAVKNETSDVLG